MVLIRAKQIQDGGRPPFCKENIKSLYLCNRLTDFDEVWHDDVYQPLAADDRCNFEFLKIQDGGRCLLENHKNCDKSAAV